MDFSGFRQVRTLGKSQPGASVPMGFGGCTVESGALVFRAKAGENPAPNIQRSEAACFALPTFGAWRLRMSFVIPKAWTQEAAIFSLTAQADADDLGTHNAPFSVLAQGSALYAVKRCDPARQSVASAQAVRLGSAQFVPGRELTLDVSMNLTWHDSGHIHATLWDEGKYSPRRLAADHGGNTYNDIAPPFACVGVYSWVAGDPLEVRVMGLSAR